MKRYIHIIAITILILITSTISLADSPPVSETKYDVEVNWEWRVKFTLAVDENSLDGNVIVIDENQNYIPVKSKLDGDDPSGATIIVKPENDYKYSTKYTLIIKNQVKSKNLNKSLENSVNMDFITKDKPEISLSQKILGNWSTSYNDIKADVTFEPNNICKFVTDTMIKATGTYKISGESLTISVLGIEKTARIEFEGQDKFIVTSDNGSKMIFIRQDE